MLWLAHGFLLNKSRQRRCRQANFEWKNIKIISNLLLPVKDNFTKISFLKTLPIVSSFIPFDFAWIRRLFKRFWVAVNQIKNYFLSVTVMSRSTKTPKGIQVPGSISFKRLLKEAWRIASSIFKMAVKFSCEKYTWSGENSSRTSTVWCEQLCKPRRQSGNIFGKFKPL